MLNKISKLQPYVLTKYLMSQPWTYCFLYASRNSIQSLTHKYRTHQWPHRSCRSRARRTACPPVNCQWRCKSYWRRQTGRPSRSLNSISRETRTRIHCIMPCRFWYRILQYWEHNKTCMTMTRTRRVNKPFPLQQQHYYIFFIMAIILCPKREWKIIKAQQLLRLHVTSKTLQVKEHTDIKMLRRFSSVGSWGMSFWTTLLKASKMEWSYILVR